MESYDFAHLSAEEKKTFFASATITHRQLEMVHDKIRRAIRQPAGFSVVLVHGPTGVGKTRMMESLVEQTRQHFAPQSSPVSVFSLASYRLSPVPMPVLVIEADTPDGNAFNRGHFYRSILKLLGEQTYPKLSHVDIHAEAAPPKRRRLSRTETSSNDDPDLREATDAAMHRHGVRVIFLDEAHHLLYGKGGTAGSTLQEQLEWLKSLSNKTGALYVLIGTYDLLPFCNLDGQMARRGSDFHFARYHIEDENDCQAFRNALSSLLKQIPLQVDHDALIQRWWYFFEGSLRCIGILKQWLVRALYRALREESPELTRAHLEKFVLSDAKWQRMRADAQSGEAEFQYAEGQNSYLSELAGMPTFTPSQPNPAPPSPSTPSPEGGATEQKKSKPKGRVGEPSPRRDQVGTAQQEGEATYCSFSGPIKLEVARWQETMVEVVQCPTCGSVSKAKLKGSSVVIALHPPRKSRPVRNVTRSVDGAGNPVGAYPEEDVDRL